MLNNAAVKCMKMYVKDMDVKGNGGDHTLWCGRLHPKVAPNFDNSNKKM